MGRYTSVISMFEKKELILGDDLRQKTRKFERKNGQYTSVNVFLAKNVEKKTISIV